MIFTIAIVFILGLLGGACFLIGKPAHSAACVLAMVLVTGVYLKTSDRGLEKRLEWHQQRIEKIQQKMK